MKFSLVAAFCLVAAASVLSAPTPCKDEEIKDCKDGPLEIALVIDASSSIWQTNFTEGLWFVQNLVDKFRVSPDGVRVSLVTYGDRVYTDDAFDFDKYSNNADLKAAIGNVPYPAGNRTETGAAIAYMVQTQLPKARNGVRKVAIVLTDGNSQRTTYTKEEALKAKETGLEIFAIGVGHEISEQELHNIASDSKHVFNVARYNLLDDILNRLVFETCGVVPSPPCQYDPVDISFVIDSSVSIGQDNFTLGMEFVKEFLEDFEINPSTVRVAAVMFGEDVYTDSAFTFDTYKNKQDTLNALENFTWRHGGRTDTGLGIDYCVNNFLPQGRSNAAQLVIVITDGASQNQIKTAESAQTARDKGATMLAVGVGPKVEETELNNIAGSPDRVLLASDYSKLNSIKHQLIHLTCFGIDINLKDKHRPYYKQ